MVTNHDQLSSRAADRHIEELRLLESSAAMGGLPSSAALRLLEELRNERALLERLGGDIKNVSRRAKP